MVLRYLVHETKEVAGIVRFLESLQNPRHFSCTPFSRQQFCASCLSNVTGVIIFVVDSIAGGCDEPCDFKFVTDLTAE